MADEGPTTAGSIVGKLKMDRDQWIADMAATRADARELGALDPTITVKANVAEALAQLEELHAASGDTSSVSTVTTVGTTVSGGGTAGTDAQSAAEARLAAALTAADTAYARAELSQMKLDAARANSKSTDIQLAAAELALTTAMQRLDAANEKALVTEAALAEAQKKAAAAALEDAAAQDQVAKKTDNAGQSMSRIQAIFTAVVALGPGLVPIASFAVGAGAALSAMLGVGVLAIVGIKNEMKSGSAEANDFAAGLGLLKGDIAQLEQTASKGVLNGFSTIVADLNKNMPELTSETSLYSRVLGAIAAVGFGGVLSSFHALSPLIIDVDAYLLSVTTRLAAFADSPGMRQFVTYAQQSLPTVENLLNSLVTVAFHLLAAFAPWGTVVVDVLTAMANVLNWMPIPVLSTIIELALGGSLAFKAWTSIPAMLMSVATTLGAVETAEGGATVATGALGAAIDIATGPIGWVVAGLGALIAVLAATAAAHAAATPPIDSYTAALQADNGVIGENVRLQAAKNLQDSGALDAAKKLGISTQTLVSASLGNAAAQKAVNDALAKAKDGWDKSSSSMVNNSKAAGSVGVNSAIVSKAINTQTGEVKASMQAYNDLDIALGGTGSATKAQYDAVVALADRYGMSVTAYQNAKAAQQAASDQLKITTQNMYLQNDAGGLLQQTLDKLNGKAISAASSQNQFDSQLANMSTHLNAAGNQILRANTLLTGNTAAAVANRGELINLTSAALSNADAYRNQTDAQGNLIHSSDQTRQKLIDMRTQIINNAVAHGEDRKAVTDFVDALYQIPSSVPTVHVEADTKAATAAVKAFLNLLGSVPSSAQTGAGVLNTPGAYGLTIPKKAGGGTVNGPGSGTSDSILHWLSNGEEVTRASRASAYQPMLKAINNGTPAQISAAASNLAGPSQSKAGATIHQVINSALGQSEAEIGNIAANQLNFLFRSR